MKNMENGDVVIRSENNKNRLYTWWRERTNNQRKGIYYGLCIGTTLILAILIYMFLIYESPIVCTTEECQATAMEILSYIDRSQEPCNDFYKFACGSFLTNSSIATKSVKDIMQDIIVSDIKDMLEEPVDPKDLSSFNLAKQFYKACMNEDATKKRGLKDLYYIFKQMGGWPILEGDDWNSEQFDWKIAVRNLRAFGINFDYFCNVSVEIDRENPSRHILGIHGKFFSPSEISHNSKVAFLDFMVDVASQFNVKSNNPRKEQNEVLNFLLELAKISEESKKSNKTNLYNLYTLSELQYEFPTIYWFDYLQGVVGNTVELSFDDIVSVSEPLYLKKLENILHSTNKRVLGNFMGWHTVQSLINYLPSPILNKAYDYLAKVNGKFSRTPRWSVCIEATRSRLSSAINFGYIVRYFDEGIRPNVTELIRNLKNRFKKNLQMLDWLDRETKQKVIRTLLSSVEQIFSFSDLVEIKEEDSIYDNVQVDENKLLKAVLDLDLISLDIHYSSLRKPVKDDWIKRAFFISGLNIVYLPTENKLKFPLGLFRGIYYNKIRPDYMNYGLLGSALAHQISHIFVEAKEANVGESKAAEEKLINWWSPESVKKYAEKLNCLSNRYSRFELREVDNIHANSLITRDEDIADLAGFKVAYNTYLDREWTNGPEPLLPGLDYTPRQLFWISSALQFCSKYPVEYLRDKYTGNRYHHSPNEFRVNGPLQNLEEFSYDFGCSSGSFMNPPDKCYIW